MGRRIHDRQRLNAPRNVLKGHYRRKAQRNHRERRGNPQQQVQRQNPLAAKKPLKRGNPQAKSKTEVRTSPSKLQQRPTIASTPRFFERSDLMKGRQL